MRLKSVFSSVLVVAAVVLTASTARAFYTVQESGDILKPEQMQFGTEVQFVTSGDDGVNLIGRFDKGLDEDLNLRVAAGFGTTDFFGAAYIKWVPFPDYESQPAIGLTFGAEYAHYESANELGVRAIPFVSKKFDTDIGELSPYAALPFGFMNWDDESFSPVQFTLGSRYKHPDFEHAEFSAEIGFDVSDAFAYISFGAIFPAFE